MRSNEAKNKGNGTGDDGFRVCDPPHGGNLSQRLGMDRAVIDRDTAGFTGNILGRRSPFTDITFSECDDVIAFLYIMADGDMDVMTDLMACSMAVLCRDLSDDEEVRESATRMMIAKFGLAYGSYCRTMGDRHHDLVETIEGIPDMIVDGIIDQVFDDGYPDYGHPDDELQGDDAPDCRGFRLNADGFQDGGIGDPRRGCDCDRCRQDRRVPYDDDGWDDLADVHQECESCGRGRGCRRV